MNIMRKKLVIFLLTVSLCVGFAPAMPVLAAQQPSVSAKAAVLIDADTGRVLYQKNMEQQLPMASTTKIMTALITLEAEELDTLFVVDEAAIMVEGSSMGLQKGDQASLRTLACGMLLPSGNDAANAAAVRIAGSLEAFAELMNARAQAIGMKNTHFVTPSGLDDQAHYSTAYDMALLARVALEQPSFLDLCSRNIAKVEFGNPPYERWLKNHNRLLQSYEGAIGVKTGYTKKSGRCLVSAAERDGVRLIAVTLNAPNDWQDHTALFDYGFGQVKATDYPVEYEDIRINLVGAEQDSIGVVPLQLPTVTVEEADYDKIIRRVLVEPFYYAPLQAGAAVGEIELYLDGEKIGGCTLVAKEDVLQKITEILPAESFWDKIKIWLQNIWYRITGFFKNLE